MIAAVTEEAFDAVAAHAPAGVEVRCLRASATGDALDPDDAAALEGAVLVAPPYGNPPVLRALRDLRALRVVHTITTGTDRVERHVPAHVTLCNARGARDVPVAEWVVGALLGVTTGLLAFARRHARHAWEHTMPEELAGQCAVILGAGSIGAAVRERLEPLGVRVEPVAGHAREGVHGPEALPGLLARADILIILLPLTDATRRSIGAAELARLRDGALIVNAGRGAVVDTDALVAELATGRLRAVLDVVDPEPLPPGHPLWEAPGLLGLTAHVAGDSHAADARAAAAVAEQAGRLLRGEPPVNVVRAGRA